MGATRSTRRATPSKSPSPPFIRWVQEHMPLSCGQLHPIKNRCMQIALTCAEALLHLAKHNKHRQMRLALSRCAVRRRRMLLSCQHSPAALLLSMQGCAPRGRPCCAGGAVLPGDAVPAAGVGVAGGGAQPAQLQGGHRDGRVAAVPGPPRAHGHPLGRGGHRGAQVPAP